MSLETDRPTAGDAVKVTAAAGALVGLGIARLTLRLNPHLADDFSDTAFLHFWLIAGYGAVSAVMGGFGAAAVWLLGRAVRPAGLRRKLVTGLVGGLGFAPLAYFFLLPGIGLGAGWLTALLTARGLDRGLRLAVGALAVLAVGAALAWGLTAVARRWRLPLPRALALVWALGAAALLVAIRPGHVGAVETGTSETTLDELPPAPAQLPPRVVLLCIDGADLRVIRPMVEAGELPTFARLSAEGTWGPLATFEPTLSAVIWTSLITGKPAEDHAIRHFLHFRLPGVRQAIYEFPLHTGLNFRFFPLLEKIPGMPVLRTPFTSNMRRAEALWEIVGRRYPVGAYRWLVTWPAEKLNGFSIAGALGWVDFTGDARHEIERGLKGGAAEPRQLERMLARRPRREVPPEFLAAYVGEGYEIDRSDRRLRPILASYNDPAATELPVLMEQFDVRFAAAAFYPVDAFHHIFNVDRGRGGPFSDAIAERYRFTDARLGELLEALGADTHVIVVSDHGFDFEHGHHTYAPPGVFFALGPAFEAGKRVDELSVYDVAPLVLHLLDMPLPEDMPGARSRTYRSALSRGFLDAHPVQRIATYETLDDASHESIESPKDDEIRDVLKSLGYIE